jgi:S-formylglutathione hydrolase FrmB
MMRPCPYDQRIRRHTTFAIYGICVSDRGRHFAFGRGYLILPVQLPDYLLDVCKREAITVLDGPSGHGFLKRILQPRDETWVTYLLFDNNCAPNWVTLNPGRQCAEESEVILVLDTVRKGCRGEQLETMS